MTLEQTPPTLAELLGTDDPAQQAERVRELLVAVQAPPVACLFMYDPVTQAAGIVGASVPMSIDGWQVAQAALGQAIARARVEQSQAAAQPTPRGKKKSA